MMQKKFAPRDRCPDCRVMADNLANFYGGEELFH